MRPLVMYLVILLAWVSAAGAAAESKSTTAPAPRRSQTAPVSKSEAAPAPPRSHTPSVSKSGAAPPPRRAEKPPANPSKSAPRTLEDIHIEGEVPVPQVLFITVRDQRRFTQFHHRRYLKTSQVLGETTVLPSRIAVSQAAPEVSPK